MTPPKVSLSDTPVGKDAPSAGPFRLCTLKARSEFLRAARARRVAMPGFILQVHTRETGDHIGIGYTCSKKVGNAVARNRAKRRLREIARLVLPHHGTPGTDYVLIGRAEVTATRPFEDMLADLRTALERAP
ncbi:ribonuclease P protein component [uncultured Tateyamaria sp.]|uniref:ribonuclease P protein component n=1 Tax=uncultured Tateyamaria sp. TaxID=455651 RepID=UPI00262334E4|nr:ribonuclease P protein component [uncultured Tateyamaria sp.]